MINILGKRYIFFAVSAIVIIPGLILLAIQATRGTLPLAIDFTGGSLLEVKFEEGIHPQPSAIVSLYTSLGVEDVTAQTTSENSYVIRSSPLEDSVRAGMVDALSERFGSAVTVLRFETVGPTIGQQVTVNALMAIGVAALLVILYMTYAFRRVPNALRYGICAILAMIHDVAVVLSLVAIGGIFWGWQIDALFLTALLTVIGFSVQDKIVVFDRVRENTNIYRRLEFEKLVNHSIVQTLGRSINTQLMTVEFILLALALFGGVTLREFATILLVGLFMGTYSSIFIAAPTLVMWENKEWRTWFGRKESAA
ncbi:MAG: protein-export membrane protein SecF [Chloroflexi bacterium RBG_16_54_18]|nr:MAG: protein-export membrane protein SecF [Chloroflexi bacterium RBG_16_54_18]